MSRETVRQNTTGVSICGGASLESTYDHEADMKRMEDAGWNDKTGRKKRIKITGYTMSGSGEEIDFPAYLYTDDRGHIDIDTIAKKIAKKNGYVSITCGSDGRDEDGNQIWLAKYRATIGRHCSFGGYEPVCTIIFSFDFSPNPPPKKYRICFSGDIDSAEWTVFKYADTSHGAKRILTKNLDEWAALGEIQQYRGDCLTDGEPSYSEI